MDEFMDQELAAPEAPAAAPETDLRSAKRTFSRIGLAMCAILVIFNVIGNLWFTLPVLFWGEDNWFTGSSWGFWIGNFAPLYAVAIPIGLLIIKGLPAQKPEDNKLPFRSLLAYIPVCMFLMYAGNIIGTMLSMILSFGQAENGVVDLAMDSNPLKILVMVILAPLMEELVCRKLIIDRTRQYGEKVAVVLSALIFGLLHQNFFQFFYAFALGLVFAFIYLRTGRLRYPVLIHAFVNFLGSVVAPWVLSLFDIAALENMDPNMPLEEMTELLLRILPGFTVYMLYASLLMGFSVFGLVLFIIKLRRVKWYPTTLPLPKGTAFNTVYLNVGMILYVLLCAGSFALSLLLPLITRLIQ